MPLLPAELDPGRLTHFVGLGLCAPLHGSTQGNARLAVHLHVVRPDGRVFVCVCWVSLPWPV